MPNYSNSTNWADKDSVFNSFPEEHYEEFISKGKAFRINILIITLVIYGIALFSLIWFLWLPARSVKNDIAFSHSPTLFFILIWIVITFISISLCFYYMGRSAYKKEKIVAETKELAREIVYLEQNIETTN